MICAHYGLNIGIAQVRELICTDKNGTSGYGIVQGGKELGFAVKAVKTTNKCFSEEIPTPCIAHVVSEDGDHYVVVYGTKKAKLIIADPAKGKCILTQQDFAKIWTGILFLPTPEKHFKKGNQRQTKRMLSFFRELIGRQQSRPTNIGSLRINWEDLTRQRLFLFCVVCFAILGTILGVAGSLYYKILIDNVMPNNSLSLLKLVSLVFLLIGALSIAVESLQGYLLSIFCNRIDAALLIAYYRHVLDLPMNFFTSRDTAEILSRMDDAYEVKEAIATVLVDVGLNVMIAIGCGIVLYMICPQLFLLFVLMLILYVIVIYAFRKQVSKKTRELADESARLRSLFMESVNGIEVIKSLDTKQGFETTFRQKIVNCLDKDLKRARICTKEYSLIGLISVVGSTGVLWLGIYYVMTGALSFGAFLTFHSLLAFFANPVTRLVKTQTTLQMVWVNFRRLCEVMELPTEKQKQKVITKTPPSLLLPIEFKGVSFRYGSRKLVLNDLEMQLSAGEKVALVGPSGAGKSTISKLLMRFYTPECGGVFFGDHDVQDLDIDWLRSRIAYLPQEVMLFSGSLEENIRRGNVKASQLEFERVCEMCCLDEFVNALPGKYGFKVSERGNNFSGGQKQRIALARALIRSCDLLILDEATSGIDSITEQMIMDVIFKKLKKVAVILIAHRLTSAKKCDRVFVVDNGRIEESGTHEELLAACGLYEKMFRSFLS
jgi:ATP-binding cassette subfamily B protein